MSDGNRAEKYRGMIQQIEADMFMLESELEDMGRYVETLMSEKISEKEKRMHLRNAFGILRNKVAFLKDNLRGFVNSLTVDWLDG